MANAYSKCNAFWTQVFKAYDEFHNKIKLTNAGEVLSEPICFNQRIRVGNTFLMHKHWIDKGVYCFAHFQDKLQRNIPWQSCFHQLSKIYDINIKWFQMRIIHRIIETNVMLKEMDVTNNNKCSFCLTAKDTIQHIFWECKHSQQFWTRFLVLLKEKCTSCYRLRLSKCLLLFGIDDNIKTENVFYFILLLAKQYLYKCKIEKQPQNIDIFRKKIVIQIQDRGIQC